MPTSNSVSQRLSEAAGAGDVSAVKAILGEEPSPTSEDLNEALVDAAQNGHFDTVRLLLEYGADPDAPRNNRSGRPANRAVENGHHDIVHLLLDHGSDLSKNRDTSDMNTAGYALHSDNEELINRIYLHGGRPNIYAYVRANRLVVLSELLDYCPDAPCKRPDGWDRTLLEQIQADAAWLGNADAMSLTLNVRPDVGNEMKGLVGTGLLSHNRIFPPQDYKRVFEMLMDQAPQHMADPDFLPLHKLARKDIKGQLDFANLFLDRGIEVDRRDPENGQTALYLAVVHEQLEMVKLLLSRGSDRSIPSQEPQETPLQHAERSGLTAIADILSD